MQPTEPAPETTTTTPKRGKQVRATDLLGAVHLTEESPRAESMEPRTLGEGSGSDTAVDATSPVEPTRTSPEPSDEPAPPPEAKKNQRPKPTALKLPGSITAELRDAMIFLRMRGQWDTSMSSIATVALRRELDRLKRNYGVKAFPRVTRGK